MQNKNGDGVGCAEPDEKPDEDLGMELDAAVYSARTGKVPSVEFVITFGLGYLVNIEWLADGDEVASKKKMLCNGIGQ